MGYHKRLCLLVLQDWYSAQVIRTGDVGTAGLGSATRDLHDGIT